MCVNKTKPKQYTILHENNKIIFKINNNKIYISYVCVTIKFLYPTFSFLIYKFFKFFTW